MEHLHDTTVLVLGLGESGLAMARWCARFGARVRVWDSRSGDALPAANVAALAEHVPGAQWIHGALTDDAFAEVGLVLKSPGLAPGDPRIAAPLQRAAEAGALVQGELELFARALARLDEERGYAPKVLAITGTNGKTTTTAMAAALIARTGKRVAAAGNIGPTMLQTLADALDLEPAPMARDLESPEAEPPADVDSGAASDNQADTDTDTDSDTQPQPLPDDEPAPILPPPAPAAPRFEFLPEVWVLELSSFQLDEAKGFEPSAAVVLNLSEDHLDWHGAMPQYVAAKARVFGRNAVMVVNRDDPRVEALVPPPEVVKGAKGRKAVTIERQVVRFGLGAPQRPGDYGLVDENGMAWLVRARELDETLKRGRGGKGAGAAVAEELVIQRLMPADALRV
ncbi:MAG: Mur ligase family protein, partial [Burkholderiaceae bacterium]